MMRLKCNLHGVESLACCHEIIEANDVLLIGNDIDGKNSVHTLFCVARADIFVKGDAQERCEQFRDSRCEVLGGVPTFWCGDDTPIAFGQFLPQDILNERCQLLREEANHGVIPFDVSEGTSEERFLPQRDEEDGRASCDADFP